MLELLHVMSLIFMLTTTLAVWYHHVSNFFPEILNFIRRGFLWKNALDCQISHAPIGSSSL